MARVENTRDEVNTDTPTRCSYASIADLCPLVYCTEHTAPCYSGIFSHVTHFFFKESEGWSATPLQGSNYGFCGGKVRVIGGMMIEQ